MTLLTFTLGAVPCRDQRKGTHVIHLYVRQSEPTRTDSPGDERRAAKDAAHVVSDLVRDNVSDDDERLLCDGEMPGEAIPVFSSAIGVAWDRASMLPSYKSFDYATLCSDNRFASVPSLGRELYDYTLSVLKKRERADRKAAGAGKFVWDRVTVEKGREDFDGWCALAQRIHAAWETNRRRFDCPNLRNGFCSPCKFGCPCYYKGKCVEVRP